MRQIKTKSPANQSVAAELYLLLFGIPARSFLDISVCNENGCNYRCHRQQFAYIAHLPFSRFPIYLFYAFTIRSSLQKSLDSQIKDLNKYWCFLMMTLTCANKKQCNCANLQWAASSPNDWHHSLQKIWLKTPCFLSRDRQVMKIGLLLKQRKWAGYSTVQSMFGLQRLYIVASCKTYSDTKQYEKHYRNQKEVARRNSRLLHWNYAGIQIFMLANLRLRKRDVINSVYEL